MNIIGMTSRFLAGDRVAVYQAVGTRSVPEEAEMRGAAGIARMVLRSAGNAAATLLFSLAWLLTFAVLFCADFMIFCAQGLRGLRRVEG